MISECFNPSCRREMTYLRDGRVVRIINDQTGGVRVEHFWLCGSCYLQYDFCFTHEQVLSIEPRLGGARPKTQPGLLWIEDRMAS